jgi:type III pantothenate kinase
MMPASGRREAEGADLMVNPGARGRPRCRHNRRSMFLAIDIGNTRLKWALYAAPQRGAALQAHGAVFLETIDRLSEGEWKRLPAPGSMLGCNVAGDAVKRRVEEQLEIWELEPRWVVPSARDGGVVSGYDHPNRLGADRWVARIGARQRPPSWGL